MSENRSVGVAEDNDGTCFPAGMRVLAVEDNIVCRTNLVNVLEKCCYRVTAATEASEALKLLRQREKKFDIVISNVERCDIDGFKLLETINLEMDIPVVLLSARDDHENVMKGIKSGASAYLIKPVRVEEMKNIWQHVVRRNVNRSEKSSITTNVADQTQTPPQEVQDTSVKLDDEDPSKTPCLFEGESSSRKKPRVVWTPDLHFKFLNALQHLGEKDAVPKKILKLMDEPGFTRENIASHLQKYRNNMKKQNNRGQQNANLAIATSHRSYDSDMNSRTLIHNPHSSTNCMMNLRPQIPMAANQAPILQHFQYPNFVGQMGFGLTRYPFTSTGNYHPPSDFVLSRFPPSNIGVPLCVDEPIRVLSSQTLRNGDHFPGYVSSIEHYQILRGDHQNSTHPFLASSASETGQFYPQQYPFNFPSINPTARNQEEEGSIYYYSGIGDSNNGGSSMILPRSVHGQGDIPSFQPSQLHGKVISSEDDDLSVIVQEFSNQGSPN